MARKQTPDGKRVTACTKFSEAEAARMDEVRGALTRSAWLRSIALAVLDPQPAKPEPPSRSPRKRQAATARPAPAIAAEVPAPPATRDCTHPGTARKARCRECGRYNMG